MSQTPRQPIDVTSLLKPGVFLLMRGDKPTYIGKAKVILIALAHHALRNREVLPAWFPVRAIPFDGIQIIPCDTATAATLAAALIEFHNPLHNRHTRQQAKPGPSPVPCARPASGPNAVRRL